MTDPTKTPKPKPEPKLVDANAPQTPDAPQTYEEARAELEQVVHRLEAGGVPLEESLALWERGEELARQCQDWLDGARRRLDAAREPDNPPAE